MGCVQSSAADSEGTSVRSPKSQLSVNKLRVWASGNGGHGATEETAADVVASLTELGRRAENDSVFSLASKCTVPSQAVSSRFGEVSKVTGQWVRQ